MLANEHFVMTFGQDCETFASFSIIFSRKNAQEEICDKKKKKTTPVTTVPDLPGLLDRCAF